MKQMRSVANICNADAPWRGEAMEKAASQMEDSDAHNLHMESLRQQYGVVKDRTSAHETYKLGSHVMQYGDLGLNDQSLYLFMGTVTTLF
ncbi:hypothetical protein QYE76_018402 [Lolium multiflorum]|uniref:Uncharacterized protein n=1 Tax=Lolium multiflorum TaxID=4521 RepID=A0AAD8QIC8_LOLMU|nr:hypothetical protein QYE76_018402 [Lolium multiflorum]